MNSPVAGEGELIGYSDRFSATASEKIEFMISTSEPGYEAQIVRLIHADEDADGPGFKEIVVPSDIAGHHSGRRQDVHPGSFLVVVDTVPFDLPSFTLQAWIAPTAPAAGRAQAIMARWSTVNRSGYGLFVDESGFLSLRLGDGRTVEEVLSPEPLRTREWAFVAGSFDASRKVAAVELFALSAWHPNTRPRVERQVAINAFSQKQELFRIAGAGTTPETPDHVSAFFDGKIDSPSVFARSLTTSELSRLRAGEAPRAVDGSALIAAWDFASNQGSTTITDCGPKALPARAVNMPARAVTGRNWRGAEIDFRLVPEEYGAIHFHSDDLEDAMWDTDFEWTVPTDLRSGVYAARITAGHRTDHIPFVVRPDGGPRPDIVVLLPTFTYLAYANERVGDGYQTCKPPDWVLKYDPLDLYLEKHEEFGKSLYDVHDDQSGVFYSSARRPIPNLRPHYRTRNVNAPRHFAADLYLIDWLEAKEYPYDVITDGDLHESGRELLDEYRLVITGSHPEYVTTSMLETIESWVHDGGRMMYLGGNGFYWVTSVHTELPHVIEVRRGRAGSRPWESQPGEEHHSTTGESGGLWRYRGKLPNRLIGVGYAAEGAGVSGGYTRTIASYDDRASWIFDGVSREAAIGAFGLVMDGAAGDELDRADVFLGTPDDAIVVASSGILPYYCVSHEDQRTLRGGRSGGTARADMVLLRGPKGGAVFSVGSISWCASLSHGGYHNDVSTITENVLRAFVSSES